MKKVLSVALAIVMMFAVCVPAFAADKFITNEEPADGSAIVKTDTSLVGAGTYEVSYPAQVDVMWGALTKDFTVGIKTHLVFGKTLSVTTTADSDSMKLDVDPTATLAYTLSGDTAVTGVPAVAELSKTVTVKVAQTAWDAAAIGEYSDTITFTAAVV